MSQEWLSIQSYFTDHELLEAINDLSIAVKLKDAGTHDDERERRAKEAKKLLKRFLVQMAEVEAGGQKELLLGVDARYQSLTDAIASARQDRGRFQSPLMRDGVAIALPLLDAKTPEARAQLLASL